MWHFEIHTQTHTQAKNHKPEISKSWFYNDGKILLLFFFWNLFFTSTKTDHVAISRILFVPKMFIIFKEFHFIFFIFNKLKKTHKIETEKQNRKTEKQNKISFSNNEICIFEKTTVNSCYSIQFNN